MRFLAALAWACAAALSLSAAGCTSRGPGAGYELRDEGPVLVRVPPAATPGLLRRLAAIGGVWGVQRYPPEYVLFMAPRPWPATLRLLLESHRHWDRPVRALPAGAGERRAFDVFNARFSQRPSAPAAAPQAPPPADVVVEAEPAAGDTPGAYRPASYAPWSYDRHTSEFLAGSVAVGILLPESNGSRDVSLEDWAPAEVTEVVSQISQGLLESQSACRGCGLSFVVHLYDQPAAGAASGTVDSDYEPVAHAFNDLNVNNNVLSRLGVTGATQTEAFRLLANQLRAQYATDWALVVKVARNTASGNASYAGSGVYAVTYLGGPFMALTLGNGTWGTAMLGSTFAHELNHAFYALDEYPSAGVSPTAAAGFFKVANAGSGFNDGTGYFGGAGENDPACIMHHANPSPPYRYCAHTQGQVGWVDDDADGVMDVMQQPPTVVLACGSGTAAVRPTQVYANFPPNFGPHAAGLGTIAAVEYRINQLTWLPATAVDGAFDSPVESFTIPMTVPNGTFAIEARATDSFGNRTSLPPRVLCGVSGSPVAAAAPFAALAVSAALVAQGRTLAFDASESSDLASVRRGLQFRWDWNGDAAYETGWSTAALAAHAFAQPGTYPVVVQVRNAAGLAATRATEVEVLALANLPPAARLRADRQLGAGTPSPKFALSVTASRDPEGEPLAARWDLDGDGVWDTPFSPALVTTATYAIGAGSGVWGAAAEVRDPAGNSAVAYLNLRAVSYDHAPVAALAPPVPLGSFTVRLDAAASADTDASQPWDQPLEYRWDFDGDGAFDTTYSTLPQIDHDFGRLGVFTPTVEVRDRFRAVARRSQPVAFVGVAPSGLAVDQSDPVHPRLSWGTVAGAVAYRVQVASSAAFASPVVDDRTVAAAYSVPLLPAGAYVWRVSALTSYYDTAGFSAAASLSIAGPGAASLAIAPTKPTTADPLQASYALTGGATAAASRLQWRRDGRRVAGRDGQTTLSAAETTKHERWTFIVTPGDGVRSGLPVESPPVEIENSPPSVTSVVVKPEGNGLECVPQGAVDADGDTVSYVFAWLSNGVALPGREHVLRPSAGAGGAFTCSVTPFDGETQGDPVLSSPYNVVAGRHESGGGCRAGGGGAVAPWPVVGLLALAITHRVMARVAQR